MRITKEGGEIQKDGGDGKRLAQSTFDHFVWEYTSTADDGHSLCMYMKAFSDWKGHGRIHIPHCRVSKGMEM